MLTGFIFVVLLSIIVYSDTKQIGERCIEKFGLNVIIKPMLPQLFTFFMLTNLTSTYRVLFSLILKTNKLGALWKIDNRETTSILFIAALTMENTKKRFEINSF